MEELNMRSTYNQFCKAIKNLIGIEEYEFDETASNETGNEGNGIHRALLKLIGIEEDASGEVTKESNVVDGNNETNKSFGHCGCRMDALEGLDVDIQLLKYLQVLKIKIKYMCTIAIHKNDCNMQNELIEMKRIIDEMYKLL